MIEEVKGDLLPIAEGTDWIATAAQNSIMQINLYESGYTDSSGLVNALYNIVNRQNDFAPYQENIKKITLNDHLRRVINYFEGAK